MATRRKRVLPPWLSGVAVNNKGQAGQAQADISTPSVQLQQVSKPTSSKLQKPCHTESPTVRDPRNSDLTVEQIVEQTYPYYLFKGSIIYSHSKNDSNLLCEDLISKVDSSTDCYMGFDTEWPVTYKSGQRAKTALIQICFTVDKCYLFHVSCMHQFPSMLKKLIEMKTIKKIGLNIENDLWKLDTDYDIKAKEIIQNSAVELKTLANQKLKSSENWSLEGLAKNVLRLRISKDPGIRKCDWSQFPLPEEHQYYAATDAAVSLMLFLKLNKMGKDGNS